MLLEEDELEVEKLLEEELLLEELDVLLLVDEEVKLLEVETTEDVLELSIFEVVVSLGVDVLVLSSLLLVLEEELKLEELLILPTLHEERINPVNNAIALKTRLFFITQ